MRRVVFSLVVLFVSICIAAPGVVVAAPPKQAGPNKTASAKPATAKAKAAKPAAKTVVDAKATQQRAAGLELFEKSIRPALIQYCYECHSKDSDELGGGLFVDTRAGLITGGDSGPAIRRNKPADSLLMHAIEYRDLEMPPDEPLPPQVVASFRRWISLGAPDPRRAKSSSTEKEKAEASEPIDLWSLHAVQKPAPPQTHDSSWPLTDIDRFVLASLEKAELSPNDDADPATLLRRVYFDLIGLPPNADQIAAFVADPSIGHYASIVDELLASPSFGERWGRHWLDVARYGESAGSSRDVLMLYAWRYRDYVINAFNEDIPFDRFIAEQVAGDLLDANSDQERLRLSAATGLLALGSKSLNGGNLTYDIIDDQIDVISKSVLGLTVACARCHDHKFDPIPTSDYYSLAGIFLSTETLYGGDSKRPKNAKDKEKVYLRLSASLSEEHAKAQEEVQKEVDEFSRQVRSSENRVASLIKDVPGAFRKDTEKPIGENVAEERAKAIKQYQGALRNLRKRQASLVEAKTRLPGDPDYVLGVREAKKIVDGNVLVRGEKGKLGDKVKRGFLSAMNSLVDPDHTIVNAITPQQSGRIELAAWLTQPSNPLTSRVAVNRIWQHLMGAGIVETVDNFGVNGALPSHPELLDHLASRFVHEHQWSIKSMVREIALSRTYMLSSAYNQESYAADSENRLRWRMSRRRLEAEPMRDAMLAVSGLLRSEPLEGSLVMQIGEGEVGRNINTSVLDEPFDHRSVYLPIIRGIIPEQLRIFDFPESSNVQGLRDANTTPTQSLFLMNSPFVIRASENFAQRLLDDPHLQNDRDRIAEAHLRCFGRTPLSNYVDDAVRFIDEMSNASVPESTVAQRRKHAWSTYCQSLLASAPFRYID